MHRTPKYAGPLATHRMVFLALLGALLLLALAQAVPALAAGNFSGGPVAGDYPRYVANDHSVYALRFNVTLDAPLAPSTQYYVKIRLSPTAIPSGGSSRGFTWNPLANAGAGGWAQERDDWSQFPTITTAADGTYTPNSNSWVFFKFGDETKPAAGSSSTWYIVVSVQATDALPDSGATYNSASSPDVTIVDMSGLLGGATSAFRVHNGLSATSYATKRADATLSDGTVLSLTRSEPNAVNEGYGGTANGDFDIAVPAGMAFEARLQNSTAWAPSFAWPFAGTAADVDVALGAADTTPPAAPDGFASTMDVTTAHLTWDAVPDAASYTVYQWQDATPIGGATNYTPQHLAVGTTAATTYDVTDLTEGEAYHFEVRAVDAAGNVGPRSRYPVEFTLDTSRTTVPWGGGATLSGVLTDGAEPFVAGQQVSLERSYDGTTWAVLPDMLSPVTSFTYSVTVQPTRRTTYRLAFASDGVHQAKTSNQVTVAPKVGLGKPIAPKSVKKGARFTAYGSLTPKQASGSKTVKIKCYLRQSGSWRLKTTVTATNRNHAPASRYSARFSLRTKGLWKLVAYAPRTAKYAATTSGGTYVKVN